MARKNYTFPVDSNKMEAIEMYLAKSGNASFLNEELNAAIDRVYRKSVPKNVRDYLELQADHEPDKAKKSSVKKPTTQPESTPTVTANAPQGGAFYQSEQFVSRE